jgi:hypothetical protein
LEQVALPPLAGRGQALVQSPQCAGSVSRLTQVLPQRVGVSVGHELTHWELAQRGASVEHALLQLPQ